MSEHELWNELGNLHFLSGSFDQAAHAYNKAIQLESDYGKPYSNLALVYAKQAKYEDAIHLYKKSLDLLTEDVEIAITWNRLGNVYRHQKEYREAVFAYQCADDVRPNMDKQHEQSNQILYVSSESESLPYKVVEEQQVYQNHSANYTCDREPEFDEALPELAPIEAEMLVNEIHYGQNTLSDWAIENIAEPVPTLLVEDVEMSEFVILEDGPSTLLENTDVDEISRVEVETEVMDESEEQVLSEEPLIKEVGQAPDSSVTFETEAETPLVEEDVEVAVGEVLLEITEAGTCPEEDAPETDSTFSEPFAQAEENAEALPDDLSSVLSEAAVCLDNEAPARDDGPIEPVISAEEDVEELPDGLGPTTAETDFHPDKDIPEEDSGFVEPIVQVEDEPDINEEYVPDPVESAPPIDAVQRTVKEEAQLIEKGNGAEEEKLAEQIEINPRNATTWEALGTLYKTAGRYEEAIQAFEQAVSIAPGTVSYYHNLGLVYSVSGNNEGAFNAFQKVLELDPNHSLTHASLGGYYKKIGLEELAQQHIGKAMKHIYKSENEYNRACLDALCGNIDQAIELLRIALENKQTYVDWVLHDPDLDSLRDDERFKQLISEFSK